MCGGGDAGGSEQHVCKVILVISLSLSQAEQEPYYREMITAILRFEDDFKTKDYLKNPGDLKQKDNLKKKTALKFQLQ